MQLQLIRNATLRLEYGGQTILIDPYLAPRHSLPPYADVSPNPLVDLPLPAEEVIAGVDLVVVSHLHTDHFDAVAQEMLPKEIPLVCQPGDDAAIRKAGFENVTPVTMDLNWQGITLTRTAGEHGTGETRKLMGNVSGFIFEQEGEPSLYWAGDTIWCPPVQQVIGQKQPDVIVVHASGARWQGSDPIVMDAAQTAEVCRAAPNSAVVATHMDALDHGTVTREALRAYTQKQGIAAAQLFIPADGEVLTFQAGNEQ